MQFQALKIISLGVCAVVAALAMFWAYIAWLKRVAPAGSPNDVDVSSKTADQRFKNLDSRAGLITIAMVIGFGVPAFFVLRAVERMRTAMLPSALLTFSISDAFIQLVAGVLGLAISAFALEPFSGRFWPEDTRWYVLYLSNRRYGCDYVRLCRGMGFGLAGLAAIGFFLGANCYVQVRDKGLAVHHMLATGEQFYPFSDISSIDTAQEFVAPNGRIRYRRDYVVHFKGGAKWAASDLPSGDVSERTEVANVLSGKSGVAIKQVAIFQSGDL